jgi:predicted ATPase
MLFYYVAMESNKDAVLVFEEPEAHAFPYYTKHLGERIAGDASNQYFIATHNPYLLVAVLEKAKKEEVAVFATQYRDYETKVTQLTEEQITQLLEADPFLGLESVLEEE